MHPVSRWIQMPWIQTVLWHYGLTIALDSDPEASHLVLAKSGPIQSHHGTITLFAKPE
jgi:hypothetical protein